MFLHENPLLCFIHLFIESDTDVFQTNCDFDFSYNFVLQSIGWLDRIWNHQNKEETEGGRFPLWISAGKSRSTIQDGG